MFSYPNLWVMITGIIMGLSIIICSVYFVNKMFINDTKDVLVRFIILVFTLLVALFIVDKVIAFRIKLLADETNKELFDLIKTLILMIFSYYFGTKNNKNE
ncbi:MAG TPA: hypothetical protein DEB23_02380 [Chitinophagaceae bacterium]|nr:hypothetical protein [Chitinophagaceae bacterium]